MILKWSNGIMGKKRPLAFKKRALNIRRELPPHPTHPPPSPRRYATGETWFKSNFKHDNPNYTITRRDRLSWQGRGVAILVGNDIKFDIIVSLTRAPLQILILRPSLFS